MNGWMPPDNMSFREVQWFVERVNKQIQEDGQNGTGMENALKGMM